MNLTHLLQMSPAELATRTQQALSKRWSTPPTCQLIPSQAARAFPDLPPLHSLDEAKKLRRHRFDLLGYRDLDFGTPIDWHFDPSMASAPRANRGTKSPSSTSIKSATTKSSGN